jgi:Flp pilus assembly protein TadG
MKHPHPLYRSRRRGNAMMEGGLVLIVFLMILFGIIDFSRAVFAHNSAQFAAREGCRWASVRGAGSGDVATAESVSAFAKGLMPGISGQEVTVNTTWSPDNKAGSIVQVRVIAQFTPITPVLTQGTWNLTGVSRLMVSQ